MRGRGGHVPGAPLVDVAAEMSNAEPLNVQCARALGWSVGADLHERDESAQGLSACVRCGAEAGWDESLGDVCCPPYGDDTPEGWACTGPLLSEYGIELDGPLGSLAEPEHQGLYAAYARGACASGAHFAEAIARLVVKLAELGKLEKVKR